MRNTLNECVSANITGRYDPVGRQIICGVHEALARADAVLHITRLLSDEASCHALEWYIQRWQDRIATFRAENSEKT